MRIVLPWTNIHPLTEATLPAVAPDAERVDVRGRDDEYWRLLLRLWSEREPFLLIEQDMEIHAQAIRQATYCSCEWSISPYPGPPNVEFATGLGCTRFRRSLMEAEPGLIGGIGSDAASRHWQVLDTRVHAALVERGHTPHIHRPAVQHHHVYVGQCSCGQDHPAYPVDVAGRFKGA